VANERQQIIGDLLARVEQAKRGAPNNQPKPKTDNFLDYSSAFRRAMVDAGLICDELPIANGQIHRFHVEGDRRGFRNGWYILFPDDPPAGAFGSWKNGDWRSRRSVTA
jgi:hypothetical protein